MTAVNNLVDQQVASGSGGNIPIDYIAETNPTGGSHLSKHLTQPVSLSESAVGLKILIGLQIDHLQQALMSTIEQMLQILLQLVVYLTQVMY